MHHIQRTILDTLATRDSLRYSEIKPDELDGNVFGYHLKSVMTDHYVEKTNDGLYKLTAKGRDYIVHRYEDSSRSAHSIFLIVIKNGSEYLLRRRRVQPLIDYSGFIHGEPEPETSVTEAAMKRLFDKTGLAVDLNICGSTLITQNVGGELHSYSHAIVLYGETSTSHITPSDESGEFFWGSLHEVKNILPSCHDILSMIESGDNWLEKSYDIA